MPIIIVPRWKYSPVPSTQDELGDGFANFGLEESPYLPPSPWPLSTAPMLLWRDEDTFPSSVTLGTEEEPWIRWNPWEILPPVRLLGLDGTDEIAYLGLQEDAYLPLSPWPFSQSTILLWYDEDTIPYLGLQEDAWTPPLPWSVLPPMRLLGLDHVDELALLGLDEVAYLSPLPWAASNTPSLLWQSDDILPVLLFALQEDAWIPCSSTALSLYTVQPWNTYAWFILPEPLPGGSPPPPPISLEGVPMPDTYKLILTLEKNGTALSGYDPLIRRLVVDQSQSFDEVLASGGGDVALPITQIDAVSFLLLTGDQLQSYKPGIITLNAGGFIILFNATGATETINNASGTTARNKGIAGGS